MQTEFPINHPLAVKKWRRELMKVALKETQIFKYMGTDTNSLLQLKTDLSKDAGDKITFGLRMQLNGTGIVGDNTLEGNEEPLVMYADAVYIDQLRHAVRSKGKMSEQRVLFNFRTEARDGLGDWFADRFDTAFFNQMAGMSGISDTALTGNNAALAPDASHVVYLGSTGESSVSLLFSLGCIDTLVEMAQTLDNGVRPISIGGGLKRYVLFLHPYQVTDMRTNTSTGAWMDLQKALITSGQGTRNAIFSGALGEYNQTILVASTRVPSAVATTRRAIFCGAQAGAIAFGSMGGSSESHFDYVEERFDYQNQTGIAGATQYGIKKTRFNGSDASSIVLVTKAIAH